MSLTLLKKELKGNLTLLVIFMAVLSMYGCMIISMFDPKLGDSLKMMAASMPDIFAAFGMLDSGSTLLDFLANYLYGFLLIAFPAVFVILLSSRLMARYVDRGSMACLLATPNSRLKIAMTQAAGLFTLLLVLNLYVTGLYLSVSAALFPGELDTGEFLAVGAGLFGLHVFLGGLCFGCACIWNDARWSTGVGAAACIAFLLLQMVARVGDKFEWVKYCTPLTLFDPKALAVGEAEALWGVVTLYALGLLCFAVGILVFRKKDMAL